MNLLLDECLGWPTPRHVEVVEPQRAGRGGVPYMYGFGGVLPSRRV